MPQRSRRRKQAQDNRHQDSTPIPVYLLTSILLTAIVFFVIAWNLHRWWVGVLWLGVIALWVYYWFERSDEAIADSPTKFFAVRLLIVLIIAGFFRFFKIAELPLGPSADEIFTLNNTIDLLNQPFDLFGHTPLFVEGWVETAHLYLYFNLLIVKLFGVSYWSMKLFSVLPGIVMCGLIFSICRWFVGERIAFWAALIFATAHWPVRLSRYGWDVSFMLMTFALAISMLLAALKRARSMYAYFSGIVAGVSLYSYLGARVCALSLLVYLFMEGWIRRERIAFRHGIAFATGLSLVAFPLLCYYLTHPKVYAVRTDELSVFNSADWAAIIAGNIWRHALMFFVRGGVYARDNYPGLPMLDPLTAFVFATGLIAALRRIREIEARLLLAALLINFAGGVFSVSQEGAPYVYRVAAVMVPVFVIVGLGLQRILAHAQKFLTSRQSEVAAGSALLIVVALNVYLYFDLEPKNTAAMRVMAYEPRLLGLEIARDDLPVFLVGGDIFNPPEARAPIGEAYAPANPPLLLPSAIRKLATITFSGRYDLMRTLTQNFQEPRRIYFVDVQALASDVAQKPLPAKMIFRPNQEIEAALRAADPRARISKIRDIRGEPIFTIATMENPPLSHRPENASHGHVPTVSGDNNT